MWPITVWTVVQAVLTAIFNSYGDRQISTPYKINTPEPIDKKFGTVDYVRDGTLYTKFDTNSPTLGFWANGWNITKNYFLFIPFFSQSRAQVRPVDGFLHAIAQKTWNHARMCLLGVWTMCPQILKVKLPKNWNFGGVNRTFKPERQKFQTLITWNLLIGSWRNFYGEYAPRVCLSGWSHGSPNKSKMAAAAVSPPRQFRDWYQHLQSQTFEATWGYFQFQTSTSTRFIIKYL